MGIVFGTIVGPILGRDLAKHVPHLAASCLQKKHGCKLKQEAFIAANWRSLGSNIYSGSLMHVCNHAFLQLLLPLLQFSTRAEVLIRKPEMSCPLRGASIFGHPEYSVKSNHQWQSKANATFPPNMHLHLRRLTALGKNRKHHVLRTRNTYVLLLRPTCLMGICAASSSTRGSCKSIAFASAGLTEEQ